MLVLIVRVALRGMVMALMVMIGMVVAVVIVMVSMIVMIMLLRSTAPGRLRPWRIAARHEHHGNRRQKDARQRRSAGCGAPGGR